MISKNFQILTFSREFQKSSRSLKQFFLTVGQNNFGNKIPNWNPAYNQILQKKGDQVRTIVYIFFGQSTTEKRHS